LKRVLVNLGVAGWLAVSLIAAQGVLSAEAAQGNGNSVGQGNQIHQSGDQQADKDPALGNACHKTRQDNHGPKKCRV